MPAELGNGNRVIGCQQSVLRRAPCQYEGERLAKRFRSGTVQLRLRALMKERESR